MSDDTAKAFLESLSALARWCQAHSGADIVEAVRNMSPDERMRVQAHMRVLRRKLREFVENLPAEDRDA